MTISSGKIWHIFGAKPLPEQMMIQSADAYDATGSWFDLLTE